MDEAVEAIMNEEKKSELDHVTLKNEVLAKYFPNIAPPQAKLIKENMGDDRKGQIFF